MADLTTKYLGLTLKNPLVVGSCDLTTTVARVKELEKNGAAAVVLKSIFEEEILLETNARLREAKESSLIYSELSETLDYLDVQTRQTRLSEYLKLIRDLKNEVLIPVIASINCVTGHEWTTFAKQIEKEGADALELNIFINPSDTRIKDVEGEYVNITEKVLASVQIPVSVKISHYFTHPGEIIRRLDETDVAGLVLFNRFYQFDMETDTPSLVPSSKISSPTDMLVPLRWITLLSDSLKCSLAASTGVHNSDTAIKMLLAGADAVEIVSAIYLHGPEYIASMLCEMEDWMDKKGYHSIDHFRGKLSYSKEANPAIYERIQFMKHFSGR